MALKMKLIIVLVTIFYLIIVEAKFDIYLRGIKCTNPDNEYYKLHGCLVRAVRGHKGILEANGSIIKTVRDPTLHIQTFWQGSSQRFQPYYIDMKMKNCFFPNYVTSTNKLIQQFVGILKKVLNPEFVETMKNGCPWKPQIVTVTNFEPDTDVKEWIPPIIPEGTFRIDVTWYENNITLGKWEATTLVKQIGTADFIKLG